MSASVCLQPELLAFHGLLCDGAAYEYGKRCISCGRLFVGPGARCGSCSSIVCTVFGRASAERIAEVMAPEAHAIEPFNEARSCAAGWMRFTDRALKTAVVTVSLYLITAIACAFASGHVAQALGENR